MKVNAKNAGYKTQTRDLDRAIDKAQKALLAEQEENGSWLAEEIDEPTATASQMILDAFLQRLKPEEAQAGALGILSYQNEDGGFSPYAGAPSTLCATALAFSALAMCGERGEAVTKANAFVQTHGGMEGVKDALFQRSDQTALYVAMAGFLDADTLPKPVLAFLLVPGVLKMMEGKMNSGVIMGAIAMSAVTRLLLDQKTNVITRTLAHVERLRACELFDSFQNDDGNFNANTIQTGLYAAGLYALGVPMSDPRLEKALAWLDAQKVIVEGRLHMRVFTCESWMTGYSLRALLNTGLSRSDEQVAKGLRYLTEIQCREDMAAIDQPRAKAARSGGWAFESDNDRMPDSDDTGSILSALGLALKREGSDALSDAMADVVQDSVDFTLPQLLDMQSPDGGWAAFVWGLPGKKRGPLFQKPMAMPQTLAEKLTFFFDPPVELGNPPVEGVTGRVLQGLGALGYNAQAPAVRDALHFLKAQQVLTGPASGAFWGRWLTNYIAATSCVLSGVTAVGVSADEPWLQNALDFLKRRQNADGGFGEDARSYGNPKYAGVGPSMPPLTALAVSALIDCGEAHSDVATRAIDYLLDQQEADGFWPNAGWLQVMMPPDQFYVFEGARRYRCLEALGLYRQALQKKKTSASPLDVLWNPPTFPTQPRQHLESLRCHGDPEADKVVQEIFERGDVALVGKQMATLSTSDAPLPKGLPVEAREYFDNSKYLPSWADAGKIALGEKVFENHGWVVALGLFTASLPQAYAAAKGARVLLQSQGMTRHARQRILETAQFIFDVCNIGGLQPEGRGIRSAQKVRLMHATLRHLILEKGEWDVDAWGVPINQEDLVGTLMTFSVVVLDVFARAGVVLSDADKEAFQHLWSVTGYLMGIHESLLPHSVEEAQAIMQTIRNEQWAASESGHALACALADSMRDYLPVHLLDDLPFALMRECAGDECADLLGLPKSPLDTELLSVLMSAERALPSEGFDVFRHLATHLMEGLISIQREGKGVSFRIPDALIRSWKVSA